MLLSNISYGTILTTSNHTILRIMHIWQFSDRKWWECVSCSDLVEKLLYSTVQYSTAQHSTVK